MSPFGHSVPWSYIRYRQLNDINTTMAKLPESQPLSERDAEAQYYSRNCYYSQYTGLFILLLTHDLKQNGLVHCSLSPSTTTCGSCPYYIGLSVIAIL
jgi:hypothetical protein